MLATKFSKHVDFAFLFMTIPNHQFLFESISFVAQRNFAIAIALKRTIQVIQAAEYHRSVSKFACLHLIG